MSGNILYTFLDTVRNFGIFQSNGGLGSAIDNSKTTAINTDIKDLSDTEINSLFVHAGLLQRIIELYPDLASLLELRITSVADIDEQEIQERIDDLNLIDLFAEATKSARLFKESYILLDVDDGKDYSEPLDMATAKGIKEVFFLEFGSLRPVWNQNKTKRVAYEINTTSASEVVENDQGVAPTSIHESRVLLFFGKKLTSKQQHLNGGYHASMMSSLVPAYSTLETAHNQTSSMFSRILTFLFKMKGLNKIQDAGHGQFVKDRVSFARQTIGTLGGILLDEETENIEPMIINLQGVPESLNTISKYFTAHTPLSHDQLWNEGSHNTASDLEDKNTISAIKAFIRLNWKSNWRKVTKLLVKEFTNEPVLVEFTVPAFDLTLEEEIGLRQTQANVDKTYVDLGVLTREIIQGNRFLQNSLETNLSVTSDIGIEEFEQRQQEALAAKQNSGFDDQKTKDKKDDKKKTVKQEDASYNSEADYQVTSKDIQDIFTSVAKDDPLLFALLSATSESDESPN